MSGPFSIVVDIEPTTVLEEASTPTDLALLPNSPTALVLVEEQKAGLRQVVWRGRGRASGAYFYTLQTKSFRQTRAFLLLR